MLAGVLQSDHRIYPIPERLGGGIGLLWDISYSLVIITGIFNLISLAIVAQWTGLNFQLPLFVGGALGLAIELAIVYILVVFALRSLVYRPRLGAIIGFAIFVFIATVSFVEAFVFLPSRPSLLPGFFGALIMESIARLLLALAAVVVLVVNREELT